MKQRSILFGALLTIFLLAGVAGANTDKIDTGNSITSPQEAGNYFAEIKYDENGPFNSGNVVKITAVFKKPVNFAELSFNIKPEFEGDQTIPKEPVDDIESEEETYADLDLNEPSSEMDLPENLSENGLDEDSGENESLSGELSGNESTHGDENISGGIFFKANMEKVTDTVWTCKYEVPDEINGPVDVILSVIDKNGKEIEETHNNSFIIDNTAPEFVRSEPETDYVATNEVTFNFSAYDAFDSEIDYELYVNDTLESSGTVHSGSYKTFDTELAEGHYTWEVKLKDDAGNEGTSGILEMFVDTEAPTVNLVSPAEESVVTTANMTFSFTAKDALSENNSLDLNYELYLDEEPLGELGSGTMKSGEYVEIPYPDLPDGLHNYSVYIEDKAGNSVMSETRDFYMDAEGLEVTLTSPDKEAVTGQPVFVFGVSGGPGLPFNYKLYINGKEVESEPLKDGDSDGFTVGPESVNYYTVGADLSDADDMTWTVKVTDCAGDTYEPEEPYHFSLDTTIPENITNLQVKDAIGETTWASVTDYPALEVEWDENDEEDLSPIPYEVYMSDFEPSSIQDMEKVELNTLDIHLFIEEYRGKPLVYGKDYWVAVIARDDANNYNEEFSICGPVQTYEDMNITLEKGWNLKSVPKRLADFNEGPESVFGEGSTVIYWDGEYWQFPETIEPCKGYWVYSPEACITNVKFKPMSFDSTTPDVPASLDLPRGWQMIGHTSTKPAAWATSLASLRDEFIDYKVSNLITYSQNEGWGGIIPSMGPISSMIMQNESTPAGGEFFDDKLNPSPVKTLQYEGYMVPGQAYWVFVKNEGTYASIDSVYSHQNYSGLDENFDIGEIIQDGQEEIDPADQEPTDGEIDSEETGDAIDEEISDQTIPAALEGTFDEGDTLNETL
jgi:hypothetical protein